MKAFTLVALTALALAACNDGSFVTDDGPANASTGGSAPVDSSGGAPNASGGSTTGGNAPVTASGGSASPDAQGRLDTTPGVHPGLRGDCPIANISNDVLVPSGASCSFVGITIDGDVKLAAGASLWLTGAHIDGNIQAEGADSLTVSGSFIDGDIQFDRGGSVDVRSTSVEGSIQLEGNRGAIALVDNRVAGDIQGNRNGGHSQLISANRVAGNLQCQDNATPPHGDRNIVQGNREDQCKQL